MSEKDGGAAFPRVLPTGEWPPDEALRILKQHAGMSLRDYFAGQVLGNYATFAWMAAEATNADVAATCYTVADAMLAERAK